MKNIFLVIDNIFLDSPNSLQYCYFKYNMKIPIECAPKYILNDYEVQSYINNGYKILDDKKPSILYKFIYKL